MRPVRAHYRVAAQPADERLGQGGRWRPFRRPLESGRDQAKNLDRASLFRHDRRDSQTDRRDGRIHLPLGNDRGGALVLGAGCVVVQPLMQRRQGCQRGARHVKGCGQQDDNPSSCVRASRSELAPTTHHAQPYAGGCHAASKIVKR